MKSSVIKRSIVIDGHKTSVSLEDGFWSCLREIAHGQQMTLSNMVHEIDIGRTQGNLSSAIRLFVLGRMRARAAVVVGGHVGVGMPARYTNGGIV